MGPEQILKTKKRQLCNWDPLGCTGSVEGLPNCGCFLGRVELLGCSNSTPPDWLNFIIPHNGIVIQILGIILLYKGISNPCLDQILTIIDDRNTIFLIDCWLSRNPNIINVTINHLECWDSKVIPPFTSDLTIHLVNLLSSSIPSGIV